MSESRERHTIVGKVLIRFTADVAISEGWNSVYVNYDRDDEGIPPSLLTRMLRILLQDPAALERARAGEPLEFNAPLGDAPLDHETFDYLWGLLKDIGLQRGWLPPGS